MKPWKPALSLALLAAASGAAHAEITLDVIGGSEVSFEGLLQTDGNWFNNDITDLNGPDIGTGSDGNDTEFELRRAELILKGKGPGHWTWVAGYDAKANKWLDANVAYRVNAQTFITVGQFKQPNSLEELTRTRWNDFQSKAMTTNLQGLGRRVGAQLAYQQTRWGVTGSLFDREMTRNLAQGQGYGLRGYFSPINETDHFLHLGLSYVDFDAEDTNQQPSARLRVRPDADLATARLVDTGHFPDARSIATTGLEAAYVNGPVKVQAEWMGTDVPRRLNPDFSGDSWYVYGLYNLTGESWGYRSGLITTPLPENPGGGLWQLGLRYDTVDLDDGRVLGGEQSNWTLGVNWYWRSFYKLTANYVWVDVEKAGVTQSPGIFQLRAQFHW